MAGKGESCSHVAAVLFLGVYAVKLLASKSSTSEANKWLPPALREIPYLPLKEVSFASSSMRKKNLDKSVDEDASFSSSFKERENKRSGFSKPTKTELETVFANMANGPELCIVLSGQPKFSDTFKPKTIASAITPLTQLFKDEHANLNFSALIILSEETANSLTLTEEQCSVVEEITRKQAKNEVWFLHREGRITASRMKSVCKTDPATPSVSLIKQICYPVMYKFETTATKWGIDHEGNALQAYLEVIQENHEEAILTQNGLILSHFHPHLGASPDGVINCSCCGKGVVEVKCPYSKRFMTINEMTQDADNCLLKNGEDIVLNVEHSYYYQVQTQIFICNVEYCDFVVWTTKETFVQRITPNDEFWQQCVAKATQIFRVGVLSELLARWYSRNLTALIESRNTPSNSQENTVITHCYCLKEKNEEKVKCANYLCKYKCFHYGCIGITTAPRLKIWYCPDCVKLTPSKRKTNGKENTKKSKM